MVVRHMPLDCETGVFNLVAFDIDPIGEDKVLVSEVRDQASRHTGDFHDPGGVRRGRAQLLRTRYLGVLSEKLFTDYLQDELENVHVYNSPYEDPNEHVDIEIEVREKIITFEVRSSFAHGDLSHVISHVFDALGPYTTLRKPEESPKDYYLRGVMHEDARNSFRIEENHTLYFAGGAPYHWFKERGRVKDLRQRGAEYWTIPLWQAMDAIKMMEEIRSVVSAV